MSDDPRPKGPGGLRVELTDPVWGPRLDQLVHHTVPTLLDRLEQHGVVDNFRRLAGPSAGVDRERRGLWFTDSDLYKWMEAAALTGRVDLLGPVVDAVLTAQRPDGYLNTFYEAGAGSPPRYGDLAGSHEWYCTGHFIEAALAHHRATGGSEMLDAACRAAEELCNTFGPGRDERVDRHPEVELAMARLAAATGRDRYLDWARWAVETAVDVGRVDLSGHAVRALYLATGIAEVALAGGDGTYRDAAQRLWRTMVDTRSYPTGAVGGRWLGESVGRPFELPAEGAYAESCAAVAATRFAWAMWRLTSEPECLDQMEVLLYNAVPGGVGADGESWFYSQPHACTGDTETDPWAGPLDFQAQANLEWFPPRRHSWFDVTCCPPNLARMFAAVPDLVADLDRDGRLVVHLPLACRITGDGWDVEVQGRYPWAGQVSFVTNAAPPDGRIVSRIPGWAGGRGHRDITVTPQLDLPTGPRWWSTDERVTTAQGQVFLRKGPVVFCMESPLTMGLDLRTVMVDTAAPLAERDAPLLAGGVPVVEIAGARHRSAGALHRPVEDAPSSTEPVELTAIPYFAWANRGPTEMRIWVHRS